VPLLFTLLAGAVGFYESPKRSDFAPAIRGRLLPSRQTNVVRPDQPADGVTPAIGGTLVRIVMMQVATVIGGMFARTYGSTAPWLILIGLKTLLDYQRPDRKPVGL
jgi:ABC-type phosphate transport system permease subunit